MKFQCQFQFTHIYVISILQTVLNPNDFYCMNQTKTFNKKIQVFFCVLQKKKMHTGLEQHEGVQIMTISILGRNASIMVI